MQRGGVEAEAQTLIRSWDFTNVSDTKTLTQGTENDTLYQTIDIDNISGVNVGGQGWGNVTFSTSLAFKGKTEIHKSDDGSFLYLYSRNSSPKMRAGVRIPAPQGYIVKVTGYAESTKEAFTWVGAEIDTDMGSAAFPNSATGTVVGVAVSGEICGRIKDYIAIENQRTDEASRNLRIYKIEVYAPNSDFKFQKPTGYDNYTIYTVGDDFKGYLTKDGSTLNVDLTGYPNDVKEGKETTRPLTREMFKGWDGVDLSANIVNDNPYWDATELGETLAGGATIYGSGNVTCTDYADISRADKLLIKGTAGLSLRVMFNRKTNIKEPTDYIVEPCVIGDNGVADVDLSKYEYVHLNAIKTDWSSSSGVVTELALVSNGINYTYDLKGDITATVDKKTGVVSKLNGIGGAVVVRASYKDYETGIINNAEYVITKPYTENKEWDLRTIETQENLYDNTSTLADWGLTWKVRTYEDATDETKNMTQLSSPVLANTAAIKGDNARFIDATAGLIFESGFYSFGTNVTVNDYDDGKATYDDRIHVRDTYNSANNVMDVPNSAVTMKVGSKLTIPNLKKGQHIRIRWDRHFWNNGELMMADNVTDLEGKSMTGKLFYVGAGVEIYTDRTGKIENYGHQEFIVERDNDVSFYLTPNETVIQDKDGRDVTVKGQQGWVNIKNIKVGPIPNEDEDPNNFYFDTHMTPAFIEDKANEVNNPKTFEDKTVKETGEDKADYERNAIYTYLRNTKEGIKTELDLKKLTLRTQNGRQDDKYKVLFGGKYSSGTLSEDNCKIVKEEIKDNTGKITETHWYLDIAKGVHGSFTLVLESRQTTTVNTEKEGSSTVHYCYEPYLLDSCHINVKVYEYDYNVKPYPYTWAMEHFTNDTGNNTTYEISQDASREVVNANNEWRYWNLSETPYDYDPIYQFRIGYPENMIAWKKRTNTNFSGNVKYEIKPGEKMVSGQTVSVLNGKETVATVTYGERIVDENGMKVEERPFKTNSGGNRIDGNDIDGGIYGGTFYTIIPKYDGTVVINVRLGTAGKPIYIQENGVNIDTHNESQSGDYTYSFNVKEGQHYKIYAGGSKLGFYGFVYSYNVTGDRDLYIPELDGLGIMPTEYWNKDDDGLKLRPFQNGLMFGEKGYCLKVPNVQKGQTLYLAVTGKGSVTQKKGDTEQPINYEEYTGGVYVDEYKPNDEDTKDYNYEKGNYYYNDADGKPLHIYVIPGEGNDIDLLLKNLTVHKMAVSVDTKRVSEVGYATEAREYPLDFTLARLFLGREQKAYKVVDVDKDGDKPNVNISEVRYIPATIKENAVNDSENNGVMITGYDLQTGEKIKGGNSWPLFTTDIDRATSDMNKNKLVGVVVPTATDETEKIIDQSDKIGDDTYYNYLLATGGYKVKYDENTKDNRPDIDNDEVFDTVEGLGFYLVLAKGTKLGEGFSAGEYASDFDDNGYKGGLPQPYSAYLKLQDRLAQINELKNEYETVNYAKVHQVFFIDTDSLLTDIDEVLIDDEDLLSTEEKNSANVLKNGVFYTLQGIPVNNPTKGIYIFNGKKVYVK